MVENGEIFLIFKQFWKHMVYLVHEKKKEMNKVEDLVVRGGGGGSRWGFGFLFLFGFGDILFYYVDILF